MAGVAGLWDIERMVAAKSTPGIQTVKFPKGLAGITCGP